MPHSGNIDYGLQTLALAVLQRATMDARLNPAALRQVVQDPTSPETAKLWAEELLGWREDAVDFLGGERCSLWLQILGVTEKQYRKRWRRMRVSLSSPRRR